MKRYSTWTKRCRALVLSAMLALSMPLAFAQETTTPPVADAGVTRVTTTITGNPDTSRAFTFYTPTGSQSPVIQYAEGSSVFFSNTAEKAATTTVSTNAKEYDVHKVELTGLKPDTRYSYRLGDKDKDIWSQTATFTTGVNDGKFSFSFVADSQAKTEEEAILSGSTFQKAMETNKDGEFLLLAGDVVDTGDIEPQWGWVLDNAKNTLMRYPFQAVAGNHEKENQSFIEHFNYKVAPGSSTETGVYYSFEYENVHFVMMNANEGRLRDDSNGDKEKYYNITEHQLQWIKDDIAAAHKKDGIDWVVAVTHKGPYTTSNHATDKDIEAAEIGYRTVTDKLFAETKVDLVLQGHDHIYARTKPLKEGQVAEARTITQKYDNADVPYTMSPDGSVYLIPNTAGAKVYYKNPNKDQAYYDLFAVADEHHAAKYGHEDPNAEKPRPKRSLIQNFVDMNFDGKRFTAVAYEIDQNLEDKTPYVIDRFGIVKGGASDIAYYDGYNDGQVKPNNNITRAEVATILTKLVQNTASPNVTAKDSFPDVKGAWFVPYVAYAKDEKIMNGDTSGNFRPNDPISRAEFVTSIVNALKIDGKTGVQFEDVSASHWAKDTIAIAREQGIIKGDAGSNHFRPDAPITRAEAAAVINQAYGRIANATTVDPSKAKSFDDLKDASFWGYYQMLEAVGKK